MAGKKTLVVYYSRGGNTKSIAEKIKERTGGDIEEIIDVVNRKGLLGFIKSGYAASKEQSTVIKKVEKEAADYDLIIIGTPVWASRMSCAVRTYINANKDSFKDVAFFATQGGADESKVFDGMEALCGKKPLSRFWISRKEIKGGQGSDKIDKFLKEIK